MDDRIISVSIQIGDELRTYTGLHVHTTGTKTANPVQDEAEVDIFNLARNVRDSLLTETSPFNNTQTRKKLIISAGRESFGTSVIYTGDIVSAIPTQPPDIGIKIKAQTGNFHKGTVVSRSGGAKMSLKGLAGQVAKTQGLKLNYQADDKTISNYSHSGAATKEIDKLGFSGGVSAYQDGDTLVVANINQPLTGEVRDLSKDSGMIGIPELTEYGIKVRMLYDNQTKLGTKLNVVSEIYPTCDGSYVVYKLEWDLATRDTPFYLIAEAKRLTNG